MTIEDNKAVYIGALEKRNEVLMKCLKALEKRIVSLEIEDKDDAVFLNGLMSRIAVLEKRYKSLNTRLDGYIKCHASGWLDVLERLGDPVDWQAECRRLAARIEDLKVDNERWKQECIRLGRVERELRTSIAVLRSRGYVGL